MSRFVFLSLAGLAIGSFFAAFGQYPGQYPPGQYPPGQYPPGQTPAGGSGIPVPWGHKNKQKKGDATAAPTFSAEGKTVSNDGKKLVITTEDGRTITATIGPSTKFNRAGNSIDATKIVPRTTVHLDAVEDDQALLTASTVELLKDAPVESPQPVSAPAVARQAAADQDDEPRPTILGTPPDDPNRPILHRGKPKHADSDNDDDTPVQTAHKGPAPAPAAASSQPKELDFTINGDAPRTKAATAGAPDLIGRSKEWVMTFMQGLPNFVCQQITTRYMEESRSAGFQPLDVLSATVIYEDGKEQYRDIAVGGKRTNKNMNELGGATSTGEFASTLGSLLSEGTQAQFKLYQSTTVNDHAAAIYDFKVALPNSEWTITVGGQSLRPAYSGSVWIDKATAQVRRIEMSANNIPKDFPLDSMEWAVDYDEVSLGGPKFLLPIHAENLGCQRGSSICTKNTIDFRNYHKYTGESTITFQ